MKKISLIITVLLSLLAVSMPLSMSFAAAKPPVEKPMVMHDKININTADEAELAQIPGVGVSKARKILEHRQNIGKFETVEDLLAVKGIGKKSLDKMKPYLTL